MAEISKARKLALQAIGRATVKKVKPFIKSKTLRNSLKYKIIGNAVFFTFPYYWWIYVHQGTGRRTPKNSKYLVWFWNPKDDPRTNGGTKYPKKRSDVKSLTKKQWKDGLAENRLRKAEGRHPFMVFRRWADPVRGEFFFDKAFASGSKVDPAIINDSIKDVIKEAFPFDETFEEAKGEL